MLRLCLFILLGVCVGCGSTSRSTLRKYRQAVEARQFDQALEIATSKEFYPDSESKLIKLLELGMLHHRLKNYYQSLKFIDQAKELSDKLYTKSISKAVKSFITSDSSNNYYGDIYERSLIRFYQSLNHFMIYQQGFYEAYQIKDKDQVKQIPLQELSEKDIRKHRDAARAVLLEWSSRLDEWQRLRSGQAVFKTDMLAKVYAAKIHEFRHSQAEYNIAKALYQQAEKNLISNYSAYSAFNISAKSYQKAYESFKELAAKEVERKYINPSLEAKSFKKYIQLSKQSIKKKNKRTIIFQDSMIAQKKPKKFFFPLTLASHIKTIATGVMTPTDFAIRVLGLTGPNNQAAISFELPVIENKTNFKNYSFRFLKNGKVVIEDELVLIQPLNEIAAQASEENSFALKARIGTRLVAKHAAAIATAYASYQSSVQNGSGKGIAQLMAAGLYLAANKGIEKSEEADLRSWHSLPQAIFMQDIELKPDNYTLQIVSKDDNSVFWTNEINITDQKILNIIY